MVESLLEFANSNFIGFMLAFVVYIFAWMPALWVVDKIGQAMGIWEPENDGRGQNLRSATYLIVFFGGTILLIYYLAEQSL